MSYADLSSTCPPGDVSDWPEPDRRAFADMVGRIILANERGKPRDRHDIGLVIHQIAEEIGLPGGECHWLSDYMVAVCCEVYYSEGVKDTCWSATEWLENAGRKDLSNRGLVELAKKEAKIEACIERDIALSDLDKS